MQTMTRSLRRWSFIIHILHVASLFFFPFPSLLPHATINVFAFFFSVGYISSLSLLPPLPPYPHGNHQFNALYPSFIFRAHQSIHEAVNKAINPLFHRLKKHSFSYLLQEHKSQKVFNNLPKISASKIQSKITPTLMTIRSSCNKRRDHGQVTRFMVPRESGLHLVKEGAGEVFELSG